MNPISVRDKISKIFLCALILGAVVATLPTTLNSVARDTSASTAASESPYVVILRHGDAPGRNEPPSFDLNDCSTQRNLSDKGRKEASELGEMLRARGINFNKVLASRWCRTLETAKLLHLGPVENNSAFDNLEVNKNRAVILIERERELIASWRGPGALLVVTHSSNIRMLTGLTAEEGAIIVATPSGDGATALRFGKVSLQKTAS